VVYSAKVGMLTEVVNDLKEMLRSDILQQTSTGRYVHCVPKLVPKVKPDLKQKTELEIMCPRPRIKKKWPYRISG
jgi:hypothetical protein